MDKRYWILIGLIILLAVAGIFVYQKYYKNNNSDGLSSSCGISNCHGLNIECGKPVELCTEMYQIADMCRQFAECEKKNGVCQQKANETFTKCKSCVESCIVNFPNNAEKQFSCESNCNPKNASQTQSQYALPVANFLTGQTKKVFGQYITPENSPIQPEKFTGYHTGVDIEQVQDNIDVPVYAISDGTIKFLGEVGGYGGVIIYEATIDNAPATILYGHIRLSSVTKKVGDTVAKGEKLAVLGTGYSSETDGERKHLHFAIHKGSQIVYLGYVQNQSQLSDWINPDDILK
ncbi:MAG: hypothetical protein A2Y57_00810 [Candidatus Woykebacteria bacterium RBG_13_40_7b]|uniref:M23ase beta-sheet core domain-containing protein n=1 Tax=Candidatus Woykebacteria bacterium RBG_13_40_7b TaxID=1802594 RepID=A0A1G1WAD3_9BACT|nr:MAG: hypothetical protein A2Y57_00810 [Candidatus Woykebacteria bacterium RBG_13_40_7b]